jgi:hypothetical protein
MTVARHHYALAMLGLLILASCGPADTDPGPGGVTNADAKALDEAAKKLDERDQAMVEVAEK